MQTHTKNALGAVIGVMTVTLLLSGPSTPRPVEAAGPVVQGAGEAGTDREKQKWAIDGSITTRREATHERLVVKVPKSYGDLVDVCEGEGHDTFWFKDGEGAVRNVIVHRVKRGLLVKLVRE
ncbi:hypothetical protein ACFL59_06920 [Planctomycetota bacterium]